MHAHSYIYTHTGIRYIDARVTSHTNTAARVVYVIVRIYARIISTPSIRSKRTPTPTHTRLYIGNAKGRGVTLTAAARKQGGKDATRSVASSMVNQFRKGLKVPLALAQVLDLLPSPLSSFTTDSPNATKVRVLVRVYVCIFFLHACVYVCVRVCVYVYTYVHLM